MADGGATVRQTFGAHPAAMAAVLRTALWAVEWPATPVGAAGERGDLGSVAGRGSGGAFRARPVRDQTGEPVALGNSDSHRNLGFEPTGVSGSRQCGPLWRESGGEFHLEPDLHRHSQRLDRRQGGVEQRRSWRVGGHTPGGGPPTIGFALRECWRCLDRSVGDRKRVSGLTGKTSRCSFFGSLGVAAATPYRSGDAALPGGSHWLSCAGVGDKE
jgi:hypothetical protein